MSFLSSEYAIFLLDSPPKPLPVVKDDEPSAKLLKSKIATTAKIAKMRMGFLLKKLLLFGVWLPPCWFGLLFIIFPFDIQNSTIRWL